jgi:hypothetical protein
MFPSKKYFQIENFKALMGLLSYVGIERASYFSLMFKRRYLTNCGAGADT